MKKLTIQNSDLHRPPEDWSDRKSWDRYLNAACVEGPFEVPKNIGAYGWQSLRFLDLVKARGATGCQRDLWLAGNNHRDCCLSYRLTGSHI